MRYVHVRVHGLVQGVGFRYHVFTIATQLGIVGWVRNLSDGTLEIQAAGPAAAINSFLTYTEQGPIHSRVDQMDVVEMSGEGTFEQFRIR